MEPVVLALPFTGRWLVRNSPARRVPSHGTELWGTRYSIDFVGVDDEGRTGAVRDWRTVLATEPPERFAAFGRPILAPVDGTVVVAHDGEPDHVARRSQLALVPHALGQAARVRRGAVAIAGNFVIVECDGGFVALVHLRRGTVRVAVGNRVSTGEQLGECGNSGNSTQPHVHVQVTDGPDPSVAAAVPMIFRDFREGDVVRGRGVPAEGSVVEPLPPTRREQRHA